MKKKRISPDFASIYQDLYDLSEPHNGILFDPHPLFPDPSNCYLLHYLKGYNNKTVLFVVVAKVTHSRCLQYLFLWSYKILSKAVLVAGSLGFFIFET